MGIYLIGIGIFIICLTLIYEIREVEGGRSKEKVSLAFEHLVDLISLDFNLPQLFILLGGGCIVIGIVIM
ncbi:hypothetical protein ICM_04823 [Bacillus cereus BAG1X2-3]|uniref:Uncharacterized protein n=1 Tax=Bacillus cereus TaxID=1396 RepID=A0A9X7E2J6_BACCE|nr:hypothetical protein [Bacillus thuringiensis]EOO25402.1 hypothetical protein ICC_04873 [Bacillus cereus BAG1X1-1]EOO43743.1 hypothetical protein ICI_05588 [Bacillus cereus BAG1X2-1]EOO45840.1 hypothetical protein ICK_05641 [Bacillus cereus BAG1X2-2]EOO62410.1 hypothetical protein ICM_04823 [Bacillus cereus BAG1X2-3]EOP00964.1 hypothetical protein ICO_05796 [Bacillus cereus BAG2O-1]PHA18518.1 hypothetical protein COE70_22255 [Bacillus cereus]